MVYAIGTPRLWLIRFFRARRTPTRAPDLTRFERVCYTQHKAHHLCELP